MKNTKAHITKTAGSPDPAKKKLIQYMPASNYNTVLNNEDLYLVVVAGEVLLVVEDEGQNVVAL